MAALPWREGPRVVLWVANLTAKPLSVRMTSQLRVSVLDVAGLE